MPDEDGRDLVGNEVFELGGGVDQNIQERKDQDGEVKVTFVVPKMYGLVALNLPEETNFTITVEGEVANS